MLTLSHGSSPQPRLLVYSARERCATSRALGQPSLFSSTGKVTCSVSERQEQGHAGSSPSVLVLVAGQLNHQTVVGRVTGGRQGARSGEHLVGGAHVDAVGRCHTVALGHEPDDRHFSVQLLGVRVVQDVSRAVPARTLHEHTIDVATIVWFLSDLAQRVLVNDLEVELELIDGDNVLSGVVLQRGSEESLGEEEPRDPEGRWGALLNPLRQEVDSLEQVQLPRSEGLQGQESLGGPRVGNLVVEQTGAHRFKIFRHDDFSDERLLNSDELDLHQVEETVVLESLLGKHSVHRLVVIGGELLSHLVELEQLRGLALNLHSNLANYLFTSLATGGASSWLDGEHGFEDDSCFVLVGDDLSIFVKTESLGVRVQREGCDVRSVVLLAALGDSLVNAGLGESKAIIENVLLHESSEDSLNQSDVLVVCYTATVVNLSTKRVQHLEWNIIVVV